MFDIVMFDITHWIMLHIGFDTIGAWAMIAVGVIIWVTHKRDQREAK